MKKVRFTVKGKAIYEGITSIPDDLKSREEEIKFVQEHLPSIDLVMVNWAGADKETVELFNEVD